MNLKSSITAIRTFLGLTDTPGSYSNQGRKSVKVNAAGNALIFDLKDKLDATVDPTVNEDSDDGYTVGSMWINVTDDRAFVCLDASVGNAIWRETTKRSILSDSVFPASGDFVGQKFRANSGDYSNRDITYEWDGSVWQPKESSGSVTFYVDAADGTDSPDKGFGIDSDAFATIQFAVDQIPGIIGGNVTLNVNGETYAENITFRGKTPTGNFKINLVGALNSEVASQAVGSATATTLTDTGAFTGKTLTGFLLRCSKSGEDDVNIIVKSHTNDVITVAGQFRVTINNTWTYEVFSWNTIIEGDGTSATPITIAGGQKNIKINQIDYSPAGSANQAMLIEPFSSVEVTSCRKTGGFNAILLKGFADISGCYFTTANNFGGGITLESNAALLIDRSWLKGNGKAPSQVNGLFMRTGSVMQPLGCLFSDYERGFFISQTSAVQFPGGATSLNYIENNVTGINAITNGVGDGGAGQNFSGNTADTATASGGQIT